MSEIKVEQKKAWDPAHMGYGKHAYHKIDPDTINPEDYARGLIGEQQHFGDVREYNTGDNEKHPETCDIDALSRIGTIFNTNATGLEGDWLIADLPAVRLPEIFIVARHRTEPQLSVYAEEKNDKDWAKAQELSAADLGVKTCQDNLWKHVRTVVVQKGLLGKEQRERLTRLPK